MKEARNEWESKEERRRKGRKRRRRGGKGKKGVRTQWRMWVRVSVMYARIVYRRLGASLWAIARGKQAAHVSTHRRGLLSDAHASSRVSTPGRVNHGDETLAGPLANG